MRLSLLLICLLLFISISHSQDLPVVPVTSKPFSAALIERRLTANAQVVAKNNSQISAEISAVVNEIYVDAGDTVAAGEMLISFDATDIDLQLQQAQANSQAAQARLSQAELRLKRAQEMKTFISADDLLARTTDVAVLKADLMRLKVAEQTAQRQINKTQIRAPFDGVVTVRQAQLGQLLAVGSAVLSLVQITDTEIQAKIPSHLADSIITADRLEFVDQKHSYTVELLQLSPVVDQQAAVQTARFKATDIPPSIGQTGQLVWYLKDQLLSADLLVRRGGKLGVFVVNNSSSGPVAEFIELPAAQEGRPMPIDGAPDWQLIIGGRERLQHGQSISIK